jgi:hypothetical protein
VPQVEPEGVGVAVQEEPPLLRRVPLVERAGQPVDVDRLRRPQQAAVGAVAQLHPPGAARDGELDRRGPDHDAVLALLQLEVHPVVRATVTIGLSGPLEAGHGGQRGVRDLVAGRVADPHDVGGPEVDDHGGVPAADGGRHHRLGDRAVVVLQQRLVPVGPAGHDQARAVEAHRFQAGDELDRRRLVEERGELVGAAHAALHRE